MPEATITFGDGSPSRNVELGTPVSHDFPAGGFSVTAVEGGRRGSTRVRGPGTFNVVANDPNAPEPEPDPASPTITVGNRTVQVGGGAVPYTSRVQNESGTSHGCVAHGTLAAAGITPAAIVTEWDDGGTWRALSASQDGAGRIRFDYGSGFTIDPGYDETTNLRQSIPAGSPLTVGAAQGRQWVESGSGAELATAAYTVTVQAAPPPAATGATAGTPGTFTPPGAATPATGAAVEALTASPTSAWTEGQRVAAGNSDERHWTGSAWANGRAPAPPPPPPTITGSTPAAGPAEGGTQVTLTGTNLTGATGVTFGGTAGTGFSVTNATTAVVTTAARAAGQTNLVLAHPAGNVTRPNAFTFEEPAP